MLGTWALRVPLRVAFMKDSVRACMAGFYKGHCGGFRVSQGRGFKGSGGSGS